MLYHCMLVAHANVFAHLVNTPTSSSDQGMCDAYEIGSEHAKAFQTPNLVECLQVDRCLSELLACTCTDQDAEVKHFGLII